MKKRSFILALVLLLGLLPGCTTAQAVPQIAATTLPVYEFTARLCQGTDITVGRLVTESVSCLHDYTLQVSQMRTIEAAQVVIISGAGLEEFLDDALESAAAVIDASQGLELLAGEEEEEGHDHDDHDGHHHESDPHIWLSPAYAKVMAQNICDGISRQFPDQAPVFQENLSGLLADLDTLQAYGDEALSDLSTRELVTFHDGFAYFAQAFDLTILKAIEEESGSEASASELIEIIDLVEKQGLPAIFTESNGSTAAAGIISSETGAKVFSLDMAIAGDSYFTAMYHNIDTVKEALG